jgi:hypothetical protein
VSWMDQLNDVLQQYRGNPPPASPQAVESHFDSVARAAPPATVAQGLSAAFRSTTTPPFPQMIAQLFGQSNGTQKAGILGHLLQAAGPAAISSVPQGSAVSPEQAQRVQPQEVQQLAQQAQSRDPSIIDKASEFYAQHPTLVKGLGAAALAVLMSHVSQRH